MATTGAKRESDGDSRARRQSSQTDGQPQQCNEMAAIQASKGRKLETANKFRNDKFARQSSGTSSSIGVVQTQ